MSYKTILVHVDQSPQSDQRVDAAVQLALNEHAHLIGAALINLAPVLFAASGPDPTIPPLVPPLENLREDADLALAAFTQQARKRGVVSHEARRIDDEAGVGMSRLARCTDLVVLGQHVAGAPMQRLRSDFPEIVMLHCARPVLLVPVGGVHKALGKRVLVAWNGSAQATRALASALALLQRADHVELVLFNAEGQADLNGAAPGADIVRYLERHQVRVNLRSIDKVLDVGAALLALASDDGADLIVMGGYGRSRFREIVLGGVTRSVLKSATLPVWMVH